MRIVARVLLAAGLLTLTTASFACAAEPAAAEFGSTSFKPTPDQPFGWRGDGNGRFPAATPCLHWSETKNVRWSATVGGGYSSPILTSELVIVMSEPNVVMALNRADGKPRWKVKVTPADLADEDSRKIAAEYLPPKAGSGLAAATPLTDGQRVYVVLANGLVQALDLDGKPVWTTFIPAQQNTAYGRASSPILCGGKLIVHMTNLFAFDPATGKQLWVNSEAKSTYATPVGLKIAGLHVIVTPAGDAVRCDTGELVDSNIAGTTHSSPVAQDDVIYFAESAVSADRLDAKFKDKELWSSMIPGDVFGSPLLHADLLLVASGKGELFAYDAKGKGSQDSIFEPRPLFGPGGNAPIVYSSLTLAGKYLFLNSNEGETVVLEATREAKEVARNHLPDGSGASPVFSGKEMYLRDGDKLYCIGE